MSALLKYRAGLFFVGGLVAGVAICLGALRWGGLTVVSRDDLDEQREHISTLEQENRELTDDLFRYSGPEAVFDDTDLPYPEDADARAAIASARKDALAAGKFLMITFGANWCLDCRTLDRVLQSADVRAYTEGVFHFVNVNVGKFNDNRDVAAELGVSLSRGIPVAIFFDPEGRLIGTTNDGQLEPSRHYSSKQILKFVRDVAERSRIAAPDSV